MREGEREIERQGLERKRDRSGRERETDRETETEIGREAGVRKR